jgi:hypothetical protein
MHRFSSLRAAYNYVREVARWQSGMARIDYRSAQDGVMVKQENCAKGFKRS